MYLGATHFALLPAECEQSREEVQARGGMGDLDPSEVFRISWAGYGAGGHPSSVLDNVVTTRATHLAALRGRGCWVNDCSLALLGISYSGSKPQH